MIVRRWLVGCLLAVYRPAIKMLLEDWGEKNIVLSPKESVDNPGAYKKHHAIYAARILDLFMTDPEWRTLVVMKSSQSGFTLHVLILICRVIAEMPMNILYVIDSADKAKRLSEFRLQPMLRSCRATALEVEANDDGMLNLSYNLPNCTLGLRGAGTAAQVASDPVGLAICDEKDKMKVPKGETHIWDLIINRIKRAEHGKAIGFSTPTTEAGATNVNYQSGSRHRFFVPCPHCRHYQTIEWASIKWSHCVNSRGKPDLRKVLADTFMACAGCGGRIDEDHKLDMMLAGEPRPTNYADELVNGQQVKVPAWAPGEMSFQISDLYSLHPSSTWGKIAVEFIRAQGNSIKLHDWTNGRMGQPVKQSITNLVEAQIRRLCGKYKRGSLPVTPCMAGMSIDNQGNHQKWTKYAFLPNGDMFVIDWGRSLALEEADVLVAQPIPRPDGESWIQRVIVDEGGKGGTSYDVRKFCQPRFPAFFPAKGRGGIQVRHTISFSDSAIDRGGQTVIPVCHFDDDSFKRVLYIDRIKNFDPKRCEDYGLPRIWFPEDIDEELVKEMLSEQLVKIINDNGRPDFAWKVTGANDWADCIKMGLVLWNIVGAEFQTVKTTSPPAA